MTTVKWERELTMTEPEESVLVKMAQFFIENGWVDTNLCQIWWIAFIMIVYTKEFQL